MRCRYIWGWSARFTTMRLKRLSGIRATSPAAALTRRRPCEYLGHALRQIAWLERLLQCRSVAPFLWQAAGGVTGDENERNTTRGERARHRIDFGPRHVDVQYRPVQRFRSGERQGLGDASRRPDHGASPFRQHVLQHEGQEHFVLHDEDAQASRQAVVFAHNYGHVAACAGSWRDGSPRIRSRAANFTWSPRRNTRALHSRLMSLPCDYRRGTQMVTDAFRETRRS